MDGDSLVATVEERQTTALNRLDSGKYLIALTEADLESDTVLSVFAEREQAAAETFRHWRDTESDKRARGAFEEAATRRKTHADVLLDHLEGEARDVTGDQVYPSLLDRDGAVERVASGLVGASLVDVRATTQAVSFFINEADTELTDLFRDFKSDAQTTVGTGTSVLDEKNLSADDWELAVAVACEVIQDAYDQFEATLADLGVDPKPIC